MSRVPMSSLFLVALHCLLLLRDISWALCAAELQEACLSGLSPAFFESTCFWLLSPSFSDEVTASAYGILLNERLGRSRGWDVELSRAHAAALSSAASVW